MSVIKKIKNLKEKEVVFVLEKGSKLLRSSANMKLMRRTGETMDKVVKVQTDDKMGRVLAAKAGVLADGEDSNTKQLIKKTVERPRISGTKIKPNFSDVRGNRRILPRETIESLEPVDEAELEAEEKADEHEIWSFDWRRMGKWGVVAVAIVLVFGLILALTLPAATVTIYARSEPVTRDLEIKVDASFNVVDGENLVIPGTSITTEVSQTENFEVTGTSTEGTTASGQVTLYNFTANTFRLNASTTTLVVDGKEFKFREDVSGIRPTSGTSNLDADPNSLIGAVSVVASAVGDSYNVPAGTRFEVRNAALGDRPEVYAVNAVEFTGGSSTATLVFTQEDYDMALAKLVEGVRAEAESGLRQDTNDNLRLLASGIENEILAEASDIEIGQPAEQFDLTLIARVTGLAYNTSDIEELVLEQIESVLSDGKYILPNVTNQIQASFNSIDFENGRGVLSVHFETAVAYEVNDENLPAVLTGKSTTEIKEILLTKPEVDRVDVEFSPFWVRKAPSFAGKVKVQTILSDL
jgi:hypothetical protein